jgi:hypothetical protein
MQKGDLLFFRTYAKYPSHVGIYLGDGKMIHASSRSHRVVVTSIDHPYYRQRFIGAKRISLLDSAPDDAIGNEPDEALGDDPLVVETDDLAAPVETAAPASTIVLDLGKSASPTDVPKVAGPSVSTGPSLN